MKDCHIRSLVAGTPAIRIRTSKMVRIRSCVLMGTGIVSGAHGVVLLDAGDGNLDIDDTLFFSRRLGVKGAMPARAVSLPYDVTSVRIVNSYMDGTSGIFLHGENKANTSTVEIRENRVRNIDGRFEDPTQVDGVVHSNVWNGPTGVYGFAPSQFPLLKNLNWPNMYEVDDNDVLNEPGKSRVEDVINLYESTGSIGAPLAHRRNLFVGAYPYDWGFDPKSNTGLWGNNIPSQGSTAANQAIGRLDDARGLAFSGGGGLSGDGAATSGIVQQYAVFDGSTLVNVFNYGHQIAGGKNASIVNCNIVNSGYVRGLPGIRSSHGEQPIQVIFTPAPLHQTPRGGEVTRS